MTDLGCELKTLINSLLSSEINKVRPHGVLLTAAEFVHAEGGGHVLVSHLVPHPPPHVHHLTEWSSLIGREPSVYCALIGWDIHKP